MHCGKWSFLHFEENLNVNGLIFYQVLCKASLYARGNYLGKQTSKTQTDDPPLKKKGGLPVRNSRWKNKIQRGGSRFQKGEQLAQARERSEMLHHAGLVMDCCSAADEGGGDWSKLKTTQKKQTKWSRVWRHAELFIHQICPGAQYEQQTNNLEAL